MLGEERRGEEVEIVIFINRDSNKGEGEVHGVRRFMK